MILAFSPLKWPESLTLLKCSFIWATLSCILSMKGVTSCQADVFVFVRRSFYFRTKCLCVLFLSLSLCPFSIYVAVCSPRCNGLNPYLCNNKSALPYKLKSPQVRALLGGPPIRQQPSMQWTLASLGLKTAASSVPLAHWRMDKALDFTLLKEGESARGAMKSIDPSLNGFVRGFRLANHGWKSPLNKAQLLSKELGQIHQREGRDNDSSWPDVRRWLHMHAMWDHDNNSKQHTEGQTVFLLPSLFGDCVLQKQTCGQIMYTQFWVRKVELLFPQGESFSYLNGCTIFY